jgi:hypothetical protein
LIGPDSEALASALEAGELDQDDGDEDEDEDDDEEEQLPTVGSHLMFGTNGTLVVAERGADGKGQTRRPASCG